MKLELGYLGKSDVAERAGGLTVQFSPNLARPKVFFDGELGEPLRFREAVSALHDVVVSDLRREKKDRTAYRAWKAAEAQREAELYASVEREARARALAEVPEAPPPGFAATFKEKHRAYFRARDAWLAEIEREDPALYRRLVPCDPIVTVARDVVLFEAFSKDESSYGCLSVRRDAFRGASDAGLGTTNVDYSLGLFERFQTLRTYRPTRLLVDPTGFEVRTHGRADYREEKIDLPASWLRGFGQLQAAMALPAKRIELSVDVVYSLLAWLRRKKDPKQGGRALRFLLAPGEPPSIEIEPWGVRLRSSGPRFEGDDVIDGAGDYRTSARRLRGEPEAIKVWGRRRLFAFARLLPLVTRFEVRLLGSGLPSVWIAHAGELTFALALSGWTANDWSRGANLDAFTAELADDPRVEVKVARKLGDDGRASLEELLASTGAARGAVLGALHRLAKRGQIVFDDATGSYRHRAVMPFELADATLGPESSESTEGRRIAREMRVVIERAERLDRDRALVVAKADGTSCEAIFVDAAIARAKCSCSFFYKNRLKNGPCRHLLALRLAWTDEAQAKLPPPPAAQASPVAAALPKVDEALTFAKATAEDLESAARGSGRSLAALLEEAWDLGFPRIQAATSWADALRLAPAAKATLANGFVKPPLASKQTGLHPHVLAEIGKVATQLGVSPSAVLNLAWLLHRSRQ